MWGRWLIEICTENEKWQVSDGWTRWGTRQTESSLREDDWGLREGIVVDRKREANTAKEKV